MNEKQFKMKKLPSLYFYLNGHAFMHIVNMNLNWKFTLSILATFAQAPREMTNHSLVRMKNACANIIKKSNY